MELSFNIFSSLSKSELNLNFDENHQKVYSFAPMFQDKRASFYDESQNGGQQQGN